MHLPHQNLSEVAVVLLRLIRSLFPAGVHDLARVRKNIVSVPAMLFRVFFLRIGTVFATSLPLACVRKNWFFSGWSRWYENYPVDISAEGLQSVQNIWKVSGWNKKCPDKCSQIIKRIQILYDKTTHDLQSVWIWNLKFLRSARTSVHLLVRSSSRKIWSLMYGQCLLNHQNHIYIRVQWKRSNCKLQFPQLDYWPRHSPDFRAVFGIMIGPLSFCEIGKTWGTNKQANKNWKFH